MPSWPLITGVLIGLSFPPYGLYVLAFVALVPLLIRWSRTTSLLAFTAEVYSAFLLAFALSGYWVLFHEARWAALLSGLSLLALPLPLVVPIVLSAVVRRRSGMVRGFAVLVTGALAVEFALSTGPLATPWMQLGAAMSGATGMNQFAELSGTSGLSAWLWLVNGAVFAALAAPRRRGWKPGAATAAVLALAVLIAAPIGYSAQRLSELYQTDTSRRVSVGIVQPGVSSESWQGASDGRRVEHLAALSERVMESQARPDLLVWPEGSLPMYPDADRQRRLYQRLASWTDLQGTALLTGALTRPVSAPDPIAVDGSDPFAVRSSALLFQGESKPQQYDKVHLVSVMERVPVERRVATPGAPRPNVEQRFLPEPFEAGTQIKPVTLRGASPARIGTLMGFESLMSSHARAFVASGAEVLVTMTQNGAWGDAPSYAQHVGLTRLRAVETRRAVVMAATSGASGLIYADGSFARVSGWNVQELNSYQVPVLSGVTFYVRHGDWVGGGAALLFGLLTISWLLGILVAPPETARGNGPGSGPRQKRSDAPAWA